MRRKRREEVAENNIQASYYFRRLKELATTQFQWTGLPDSIDERYLEICLFEMGHALFFEDEVMGFLCLPSTDSGPLDIYRNPILRRAYANNGYQKQCDQTDSVIIYNNYLREPSVTDVLLFANKLTVLDRTIEVNANAQKTPVLILCDENQRLTLENVYSQYQGNAPVIYGNKNLDINSVQSVNTGAPYLCDKLYDLKTNYWNEALTYLGISNVSINKKERLITDEVQRLQGGTICSRYSRLEARKQACEKINAMFGLNIDVFYRENNDTGEGDDDNFAETEEVLTDE